MGKYKSHYVDTRYPRAVSEAVSKSMKSNKGKDTRPELLFRKALWKVGLRGYRLHWKGVPGRPDVAFVSKKLAIFINGCYWHRCPKCALGLPKSNTDFWKEKFKKNVERDERKKAGLESLGWRVEVIWECDLKNDVDTSVGRIADLLAVR